MSEQDERRGRINLGGEGLGLADESMAAERATELARMDGRTVANQKDLDQARLELQGGESQEALAPEAIEPGVETFNLWESLGTDSGQQAPTVGPMDEQTAAESLVHEGMEEAEHEQRLSASEELANEESLEDELED